MVAVAAMLSELARSLATIDAKTILVAVHVGRRYYVCMYVSNGSKQGNHWCLLAIDLGELTIRIIWDGTQSRHCPYVLGFDIHTCPFTNLVVTTTDALTTANTSTHFKHAQMFVVLLLCAWWL